MVIHRCVYHFCSHTRFGYWAVCMCLWMKVKVCDQSVSPVKDHEVTAYISMVVWDFK